MDQPTSDTQFDPLMNCLEVTQRSMEFVEMYKDFADWPKQTLIDQRGMQAIEMRVNESIEFFNDIVKQLGGIPVRVMMRSDQPQDGQVTSVIGFYEGRWILELQLKDDEKPEMLFSNTTDLRFHHLASFPDTIESIT